MQDPAYTAARRSRQDAAGVPEEQSNIFPSESAEIFSLLFHHSREALGIAAEGKILYANEAYARMMGFTAPEELAGLSTMEVVALSDRERLMRMARQRAEGAAVPDVYEFRGLRRDGTEIDVENRVTAYSHDGARYTLVISRDVTARNKRLRSQRFLAEAGALLSSSLDITRTLENIARLAVPHLADWCIIHLVDDSGRLDQVAVVHVDAAKVEMVRDAGERYPPDPDDPGGVCGVLRSGQSQYVNDISEEMLLAAARDDEHLRILLTVGIRSYLCVAMIARDRKLGTISFLGAESGHRYGPEDVTQAEELAQRAAFAVDNASLYRSEQEARQEAERAAARLRQAMTETHHRVKNNLQVVAAMIDMQLGQHDGQIPRSEFERISAYVRTLAALHDLLTQQAKVDASADTVSAHKVLEKVVAMNLSAAAPRLIRLQIQDAQLTTRQATGLALVLNELISNSIKHGAGDIEAVFRTDNARLLEVRDSGPGFPAGFQPDPAKSTGLELVDTIARWDLGGKITFCNQAQGGACVQVVFPME